MNYSQMTRIKVETSFDGMNSSDEVKTDYISLDRRMRYVNSNEVELFYWVNVKEETIPKEEFFEICFDINHFVNYLMLKVSY